MHQKHVQEPEIKEMVEAQRRKLPEIDEGDNVIVVQMR